MGLACTAGEGEMTGFAEVLAGGGDAGADMSIRRSASTSSWKGSVRLMLVSLVAGPVICYGSLGDRGVTDEDGIY